MLPEVFVKPKAGRKVPFYPLVGAGDPRSPYVAESGEMMEDSPFIRRRENEGDVDISDAPPAVIKNALSAPAPAGKAEKVSG